MRPTDELKPLLTPDEFQRLALDGAIGRNSIYALIRSNRIKHIRVGRKILIPRSEVVEFARREAGIIES